MDKRVYLEGSNLKWGYKKGFMSRKYWGKDERESFKMVWACVNTGISQSVRKIEGRSLGDLKRERARSNMT